MLRYLSVCSGVEAASVAWHPLGWQAVGFSEIESFPAAVLAHHYPTVPNFGDLTKHETWNLAPGSIDLLVGGTPCQAFSVAGKRAGLDDPRGQLMLAYLDLAGRLRPQWIVWENVPGVLSSNGGRDFGAFLGGLEHLGYGWAYRVLDAQWVRTQRHPRAVPQRRRRVFVVGCLGDATSAAAVLFERESVQRNPAKGAKARQGAAADARSGTEGGGRQWPAEVTCTLNTMYSTKLGLEDQHALHGAPAFVLGEKPAEHEGWREGDQANAAHCVDFAGTLNCDKGQQGGIIAQPVVVVPLAFSAKDYGGDIGTISPTLRAGGFTTSHANGGVMPAVLVPAQPVNPAVATTLSARDHKGPSCGRDGVVGNPVVVDAPQQPIVIDRAAFNARQNALYTAQIGASDTMPSLVARGPHAIAHALTKRHDSSEDGTGRGVPLVVDAQPVAFQLAGDRSDPTVSTSEVAFCLPANPMSDRAQAIAYPLQDGRELDKRQNGLGIGDANDPAYTVDCTGAQAVAHALTASASRGATEDGTGRGVPLVVDAQPVAIPINGMTLNKELRDKQMTGIGDNGDPMFTIRADGTQHAIAHAAIAFKPGQSAAARTLGAQEEVACTLEAGGGGNNRQAVAHAIAFEPGIAIREGNESRFSVEVAPTLRSNAGDNQPAVAHAQPVPFRDPSPTLTAKMQGASGWAPYNEDAHLVGVPQAVTEPIAFHHNAQACQLPSQLRDTRVTDTLTVSQNAAVALSAPTLTAGNDPSRSPQSSEVTAQVAAVYGASLAVRRLTPRECERLQGFPDDYTAIAYRNKPAADGPRYKAMGNSMAVNCMAWIGERIAAVNARIR